jgi:hypothetical protein
MLKARCCAKKVNKRNAAAADLQASKKDGHGSVQIYGCINDSKHGMNSNTGSLYTSVLDEGLYHDVCH